jgi:hypothetical protein
MSEDLEALVQRSLDAVDRAKRLAAAATGALFLIILFALGYLLANGSRGEDAGRSKVLFVVTAAEMAFIGLCTAVLAGHVSRMTKAVLRAIELKARG